MHSTADLFCPHGLIPDGRTTLHALGSLEARRTLFAGVATEVYAGMIVGSARAGPLLSIHISYAWING